MKTPATEDGGRFIGPETVLKLLKKLEPEFRLLGRRD
ncbi:MAG: hypothetical protein AB203_00010 [Parcubacteria bacterium C7867-008]|nr:MAG: hypothetical protein AB203_00010 [Parcubacteria bacterium C7867-008]